jgi:hypothetical protein
MIIRLLQAFEDIVWDPEASPQSLPPPEWAESDNLRKREEKVRLRSHLTMYAKVSDRILKTNRTTFLCVVRFLAQNGYWVKFKEAER